jgi:hypothetical protein
LETPIVVLLPNAMVEVRRRQPLGRLLLCALVMVLATGCVQRRMTIRSNPPGALVYIDNYEIGTTPVSVDYIYYGTREIRLIKDGFETLKVNQWIPPPWYDIFPLDFFTENIVPFEIRDARTLDFQLSPQIIVPTDRLLERAENLRRGSRTEGFVAPPRVEAPTGIALPPWVPNVSGAGTTVTAPPGTPTINPLPPRQ